MLTVSCLSSARGSDGGVLLQIQRFSHLEAYNHKKIIPTPRVAPFVGLIIMKKVPCCCIRRRSECAPRRPAVSVRHRLLYQYRSRHGTFHNARADYVERIERDRAGVQMRRYVPLSPLYWRFRPQHVSNHLHQMHPHTTVPNSRPTRAVRTMAKMPQKTTRPALTHGLEPPA